MASRVYPSYIFIYEEPATQFYKDAPSNALL